MRECSVHRREKSSWGITLLGRGVLFAGMLAAAYSVKGTGVNAERGMAHGSSTFEESRSLVSSVNGIGETLRSTLPWTAAHTVDETTFAYCCIGAS
jgi:hypothetical protein